MPCATRSCWFSLRWLTTFCAEATITVTAVAMIIVPMSLIVFSSSAILASPQSLSMD
jgi:hypothetical protein